MRLTSLNLALIFIVASMLCDAAMAVDGHKLDSQFQNVVLPFVRQHCLECHGAEDPEAKFDLSRFRSAEDVVKGFATWQHVADRVQAGEMPPADSRQPTLESRQAVLKWSRSFRKLQAQRNAGDPGPVLARRLSVAEYNNTIRDLTGYDIRPARHFPVDRTNQAGFDNSGESLEMTPGLLTKYLEAARAVSERLVLKPDGIGFASHAVVVDTDRDKYCVRRIIEFYDRQNTNYADYFFAAWRLRQKIAEGRGNATDEESLLAVIAREERVSPKYLRTVWSLLRGEQNDFGPIARLRSLWKALPSGPQNRQQAQAGCVEMSKYVSSIRPQLTPSLPYLSPPEGINHGTQPVVLWRNRKLAAHRRVLNEDALVVRPNDLAEQKQRLEEMNKEIAAARRRRKTELESRIGEYSAKLKKQVQAKELSEYQAKQELAKARKAMAKELEQFRPKRLSREELMIPVDEAQRSKHVEAFAAFCDIFPDTFFVRSRGRDFKNRPGQQLADEGKVRLLSAGFHSQMGYFRDDAPLYDLVLSKNEQRELDGLWLEFDFIADISRRQHQDYLWYERSESRFISGPEFDFARGEDEGITSQANIERLAKVYLAKAKRTGASAQVLDVISDHYRRVNANIREVESARKSAEPKHVESLKPLAAKAFRRPLSDAEASSIVAFYDELRKRDRLSHEEAIRDCLVWILMSPHFCYSTLPSDSDKPIHPLSQFALASRLSYFLWSSMPDEQLLESAARGELNDPKIIKSHVRRMIRDDRIRGFAQQFVGNWLGYAGFEKHKGVNRERFPQFDDQLREAMSREPTEFVIDLLRRDGSLLEFIDADHTFVNDALARHYGMEIDQLKPGQWKRVDQATQYGRGGILPMSVFLTKNAHALRTSPVRRGYWVASQLLGERIPPPPPNVPELPPDESQTGEASLVQMLAKHRAHASCAGCHDRFDSLGVAFEGFDPIGRLRNKDMGGRPVQTRIAMPDGVARSGVAGLRDYIHQQRQKDFLDTACWKLLSYSLGRTLIVADDVLLDSMRHEVQESTTSLTSLIELIVTSSPFLEPTRAQLRQKRGRQTQGVALMAIPHPQDRTSRRTMLRGMGVAVALPWMESIPVWGSEEASSKSPDERPATPKRIATLFMANGINPRHWHAAGAGEDMKLGKCLEPFEPFKSKMNVISGLYNQASLGVGIHPGQTGNLLSGVSLKRGSELGGGISMDQVIARRIGQKTIQSSLVLGCEQPVTGYHETNFSMAYSSHISWQNETSPVPMETYPALAFDSLFENGGMARHRSILDRVQADARSLARRLSTSDREKLDEYLTSVREVEQRIERIRKASDKAAARARDRGRPLITMERPDNGLPEDIREHMRLMCDIIAMAFQTDKTRVATLMLNIDISGMIYPFLGIRYGHHGASHRDHSDDYLRIVQYHCSQAAYLAKRLEAMPEGDSNVLENSLVMFMSNMWSGSKHESSRVPVVQIGGLGGTLKTGRVLDYTERGDDNRRLCSLYLSIMDRMGVRLDRFGDAERRLADL